MLQQRQLQLRCQQVKLQLVDLVQRHQQEDSAVQRQTHQQAGVQHLAQLQQEASAHQRGALAQHQQAVLAVQALERDRLAPAQVALVAQAEAGLEAHLASVARRGDSAAE